MKLSFWRKPLKEYINNILLNAYNGACFELVRDKLYPTITDQKLPNACSKFKSPTWGEVDDQDRMSKAGWQFGQKK